MFAARKTATTALSVKQDVVKASIDIFTDRRNQSAGAKPQDTDNRRKQRERKGTVIQDQYRQGWWLRVGYAHHGLASVG